MTPKNIYETKLSYVSKNTPKPFHVQVFIFFNFLQMMLCQDAKHITICLSIFLAIIKAGGATYGQPNFSFEKTYTCI